MQWRVMGGAVRQHLRGVETYGGVDYAFNNAGIEGEFGPLDELGEAVGTRS